MYLYKNITLGCKSSVSVSISRVWIRILVLFLQDPVSILVEVNWLKNSLSLIISSIEVGFVFFSGTRVGSVERWNSVMHYYSGRFDGRVDVVGPPVDVKAKNLILALLTSVKILVECIGFHYKYVHKNLITLFTSDGMTTRFRFFKQDIIKCIKYQLNP